MVVVLVEMKKTKRGTDLEIRDPSFHFGHVRLDKLIRQSTSHVKIAVGDNIRF